MLRGCSCTRWDSWDQPVTRNRRGGPGGPGVERPMQQLSWRSSGPAASRSGAVNTFLRPIRVDWKRPGPWNARTAPPLGVPQPCGALGDLCPSTALACIATTPASHAAGAAVAPDARGFLVSERRRQCRLAAPAPRSLFCHQPAHEGWPKKLASTYCPAMPNPTCPPCDPQPRRAPQGSGDDDSTT